jgi:hypothetical protein
MQTKSTALEVLYRVWVSQTNLTVGDAGWLASRAIPAELPIDTCLRLAGFADAVGQTTEFKRTLLEHLRYDAMADNRFKDDSRYIRRGSDWVLDEEAKARQDEYGRRLELHPRTFFPPSCAPESPAEGPA